MADDGDGGAASVNAPGGAGTQRFTWRLLALAAGPGLVAMLADTDAGSIITVAQSGAQWGYRLLLPNLLLIPFMFMAQEVALRLGLGARQGVAELVLRRFGRMQAGLLLVALALSCFGALVSEMSGLAGAARAFGLPIPASMAGVVVGLILMVVTGSYRSVERVALFFGLFELAFLVMAWRAAPGLGPIVQQAGELPLRDPGYLYLLAANLGTSIIPWALLYQQSASVDKGLGPRHVRGARLETLAAVVLCQTITSALLIAAGATLGGGGALNTVAQIETAFTATLGPAIGRAIFILGLSGGALVATIVVCLTLAWSVGEVLGVRHSLEHHPRQAPWFYGSMAVMLVAGGVLVASGIDLVSLSIAAGVLNALLLPVVLGFLYRLARTALPEPLRLRGAYAAVVAVAFLVVSGVAVWAGVGGFF
jgi:Mn2+/Fe2+ NRAMP family transporter